MPTMLSTREPDGVTEEISAIRSGVQLTTTHGCGHIDKQCSLCNYRFSVGHPVLLVHSEKHQYRLCLDCRQHGDLELARVATEYRSRANRCLDDGLTSRAKNEMFSAWVGFAGAVGWLIQAGADHSDILPVLRKLVETYALRGDSTMDSPERQLRTILGLWELSLGADENPVIEVLKLLRATYDLDGRHADAALIEARLTRIADRNGWQQC